LTTNNVGNQIGMGNQAAGFPDVLAIGDIAYILESFFEIELPASLARKDPEEAVPLRPGRQLTWDLNFADGLLYGGDRAVHDD